MLHSAGDDFSLRSGLDFESCGSQRLASEPSCCPVTTPGYECLLAALASCSPARLEGVYGTLEGDSILQDYFVMPLPAGCEVVVVHEGGEDAYRDPNYPAVSQPHGRTAHLRAATEASPCPAIVVGSCLP